MMAIPFSTQLISLSFLLVITQFLSSNTNITLASMQKSSHNSLVIGLRHSRDTLPSPRELSAAANDHSSTSTTTSTTGSQSSEAFTMMEPVRAVRDGYLIPLYLGTPPQVIQVYMDTGSDLTWVPCGSNLSFECLDCDDYRNNKLVSVFSPFLSSSALRDLCSSSFCVDIHSSDNYIDPCTMAGCSLSNLIKSSCSRPCPSFAYTYGAGGVVTGMLTRDTLRVHENMFNPNNLSREILNFSFGCVGSTYREPIGIAGFGKGSLSLPSQLGFLHKAFSHCFLPFKFANNPNISSPLVIGDSTVSSDHDENLHFTPMLKSPMYPNNYYIGLEAITVGNSSWTEAPLSMREFDLKGNGGMLIDSGTTYTHLPEPIYSQLLSTLHSAIPYPRSQDMEIRTGFDLCYIIPFKSQNNTLTDYPDFLPPITFHFLNNVSLVLSEGSHFYAMQAPRNSTVVKCLLFQSMEDGDYGPAGVFGSFQQQNLKVVYDLEKERIGFQPMDCASAAASRGLARNPNFVD